MAPRLPNPPHTLPRPTDAELAILAVLWRLKLATVREVHEALTRFDDGQTGYTTTLKLLQIMHAKGLVQRDDSQRAHIYGPTVSKERTQEQLLGDLARRVFDDSPTQLALQALGNTTRADPEELDRIREMLGRLERTERARK